MAEELKKETEEQERDHSELGGSSAYRWVNCPGSIVLARMLPKLPPGEPALAGTKAHELAEVAIKDLLEEKLSGTPPYAYYDQLKANYDDAMQEAALEYREAIWENVLQKSVTGKAFGTEEEFVFDAKLDSYGYVDFWALYIDDKGRRTGVVADFKYGYSPVSILGNGQLAFYSVALRRYFRENGKDIDQCKVVIFQPRQTRNPSYQEDMLSAKKLDAWEKKFTKAAEAIYVKEKASFKTGDWCQWCPGQVKCIKYAKEQQAKLQLSLIDVNEIKLPEIETISDETLANIIRHGDALEKFVKGCRAFALNRHAIGKPLPGLKVVESKPRRKWKENVAEIVAGLVALGLDPNDVTTAKLKSLTLVEKLAGKGRINAFLTQSTPRPVLVDASDERPAVKNLMELLSDEVGEED